MRLVSPLPHVGPVGFGGQYLYPLSHLSCPPCTLLKDLVVRSCKLESLCKSEIVILKLCGFPPRLQIIIMKKEPAFFVVSYIF